MQPAPQQGPRSGTISPVQQPLQPQSQPVPQSPSLSLHKVNVVQLVNNSQQQGYDDETLERLQIRGSPVLDDGPNNNQQHQQEEEDQDECPSYSQDHQQLVRPGFSTPMFSNANTTTTTTTTASRTSNRQQTSKGGQQCSSSSNNNNTQESALLYGGLMGQSLIDSLQGITANRGPSPRSVALASLQHTMSSASASPPLGDAGTGADIGSLLLHLLTRPPTPAAALFTARANGLPVPVTGPGSGDVIGEIQIGIQAQSQGGCSSAGSQGLPPLGQMLAPTQGTVSRSVSRSHSRSLSPPSDSLPRSMSNSPPRMDGQLGFSIPGISSLTARNESSQPSTLFSSNGSPPAAAPLTSSPTIPFNSGGQPSNGNPPAHGTTSNSASPANSPVADPSAPRGPYIRLPVDRRFFKNRTFSVALMVYSSWRCKYKFSKEQILSCALDAVPFTATPGGLPKAPALCTKCTIGSVVRVGVAATQSAFKVTNHPADDDDTLEEYVLDNCRSLCTSSKGHLHSDVVLVMKFGNLQIHSLPFRLLSWDNKPCTKQLELTNHFVFGSGGPPDLLNPPSPPPSQKRRFNPIESSPDGSTESYSPDSERAKALVLSPPTRPIRIDLVVSIRVYTVAIDERYLEQSAEEMRSILQVTTPGLWDYKFRVNGKIASSFIHADTVDKAAEAHRRALSYFYGQLPNKFGVPLQNFGQLLTSCSSW
ncbi:hypothetical protein Pelo_13903 [Pelomyxa schiedti]|nr:hypothetical protein Pelo_13903 [Pelomyxa schiedti]